MNYPALKTQPVPRHACAVDLFEVTNKRQVLTFFYVHRAVHRNIISIVKPTRYTSVSNLFYFGMTLYMFRTVFPSIIRIEYIEYRVHSMYSLELLMMDGKTVRNM